VAVSNLPQLAVWMARLEEPLVMQVVTGPTPPDCAKLMEASTTICPYYASGHPIANRLPPD